MLYKHIFIRYTNMHQFTHDPPPQRKELVFYPLNATSLMMRSTPKPRSLLSFELEERRVVFRVTKSMFKVQDSSFGMYSSLLLFLRRSRRAAAGRKRKETPYRPMSRRSKENRENGIRARAAVTERPFSSCLRAPGRGSVTRMYYSQAGALLHVFYFARPK